MPDPALDPLAESGPLRNFDHGCDPNRCERFFWIGALALGFLQAWGRRHESADGLAYIGADSISYLDIGDAYMRGDFYVALNAMWSPFYSWLVGLALKLFKPSPFWEFTVVRLLNFLIYIFALFAFAYFLRALRRDYQSHNHDRKVPEWSWLVFGYTIFIWTSLLMNRVSRVSPDLLVAALMFLACGLLLRLRIDASRWPLFVAMGIVLGVGYLTKAIFFPLALVFIAVVFLSVRRTVGNKAALLQTMVALLVFLTLAMPFIIVLSQAKHRFTIGESARLNYAWYVNGTTRFTHWQGEPGSGIAAHPTRKIFESPAIYEFGGPPGVTYPPWYDPTYWYEGVTPAFNLRQQLAAIFRNLTFLYGFLYYRFFLVAIGMALFVLLYQSGPVKVVLGNLTAYWFLLLPSLIGVGLYLLINVEPRYLAPFVPVIALSMFAAVRTSQTIEAQRLLKGISFAVIVFFIVSIAPLTVRAGYSVLRELSPGRAASRDVQWQVADGLRQIGVQPGERIAVIGKPMFDAWPRLARVRVVAELPETSSAELFWSADENIKQQVLDAFAGAGARVVVADSVPRSAKNYLSGTSSCWQRIGSTDHYACFLR